MAVKPAVKSTRVVAKKSAPAKKSAAKAERRIQKGDAYHCEVCGLQVHVDACGEYLESQELICCGKLMAEKASKARSSKK